MSSQRKFTFAISSPDEFLVFAFVITGMSLVLLHVPLVHWNKILKLVFVLVA